MKSEELLKVGIVGCGDMARMHLAVWRRTGLATVTAVCDTDSERAANTANSWKIPSHYTDVGEMIRNNQGLVVDVCTPPQAHKPVILQALDSECNVITEKPLTMTTDDARLILNHQRNKQVKITVIHNWLYSPAVMKSLSLVKSGVIGDIIGVNMQVINTPEDSMLKIERHWCHSLPGGRMGEMLAHPAYIIQAFMGRIKVESVHCMKRGKYPWVNCDELLVGLSAERGTASIYATFNGSREDVFIKVYGTDGILEIGLAGDIIVKRGKLPHSILGKGIDNLQQGNQYFSSTIRGAFSKITGRWQSGTERCIKSFADSIIHGGEPLVSLQQAYDSVEVLDDICQKIDSVPDAKFK